MPGSLSVQTSQLHGNVHGPIGEVVGVVPTTPFIQLCAGM